MTYFIIIFIILIVLFIIESSFLTFKKNKLPILMYHKVSTNFNDNLTVSIDVLEKHFKYFKRKKYNIVSFPELKDYYERGKGLPKKPLIITFDDGYLNNYELAYPLLKKYNYKATFFIPVYYIGKTNEWDEGEEKIIDYSILKELSSSEIVDIGLHSYSHKNFKNMSIAEMEADIKKCENELNLHSIDLLKVFAYPYGGFPKRRKNKKLNLEMKKMFSDLQLDFAVRIGKKINKLPLVDRYELKRISIHGDDSDFKFKTKMLRGRVGY